MSSIAVFPSPKVTSYRYLVMPQRAVVHLAQEGTAEYGAAAAAVVRVNGAC